MYPRCCGSVLGGWLAVTAICLSFSPARADTVFDLTGTFTSSAVPPSVLTTVSGTLTINLTTGIVDAANLSYLGNTYSTILTGPGLAQGPFTGGTDAGQTPVPVGYLVDIGSSAASTPRIEVLIKGTSSADSLVSYAGGPLCSLDAFCGPDQVGVFWISGFNNFPNPGALLQVGELTPTPLPAALPLFASGLVGLVLLGWRRKRKGASSKF
jgi:hypothetical protein